MILLFPIWDYTLISASIEVSFLLKRKTLGYPLIRDDHYGCLILQKNILSPVQVQYIYTVNQGSYPLIFVSWWQGRTVAATTVSVVCTAPEVPCLGICLVSRAEVEGHRRNLRNMSDWNLSPVSYCLLNCTYVTQRVHYMLLPWDLFDVKTMVHNESKASKNGILSLMLEKKWWMYGSNGQRTDTMQLCSPATKSQANSMHHGSMWHVV